MSSCSSERAWVAQGARYYLKGYQACRVLDWCGAVLYFESCSFQFVPRLAGYSDLVAVEGLHWGSVSILDSDRIFNVEALELL